MEVDDVSVAFEGFSVTVLGCRVADTRELTLGVSRIGTLGVVRLHWLVDGGFKTQRFKGTGELLVAMLHGVGGWGTLAVEAGPLMRAVWRGKAVMWLWITFVPV